MANYTSGRNPDITHQTAYRNAATPKDKGGNIPARLVGSLRGCGYIFVPQLGVEFNPQQAAVLGRILYELGYRMRDIARGRIDQTLLQSIALAVYIFY